MFEFPKSESPEKDPKETKKLAQNLYLMLENMAANLETEEREKIENHIKEALDIAKKSQGKKAA